MDLGLSGRTVVIAAAISPIATETAKLLAAEGAKVTLCGPDEAKVKAAAAEAGADPLVVDVATADGCAALATAVPDVDVLVQDLGARLRKPFFETDDDDWRGSFDNELMTSVRLTKAYLPKMLDAKRGRIVFVASVAAVMPVADLIAASASQAAQLAVMRGLATLTKGGEVTINAVITGPTHTTSVMGDIVAVGVHRHSPAGAAEHAFMDERAPTGLASHLVEPSDVAALIAWVAGDHSAATNGAVLRADGGIVPTIG